MKHSLIILICFVFSVGMVPTAIRSSALYQIQNNNIILTDAEVHQLTILSALNSESRYFSLHDAISDVNLQPAIAGKNKQITALSAKMIAGKPLSRSADSLTIFLQSVVLNKSIDSGEAFSWTGNQLATMQQLAGDRIKHLVKQANTLRKKNASRYTELETLLYGAFILLSAAALIYLLDIRKTKKIQSAKEEKLAMLLDAAPDATVIVDEKGKITAVSKQTEHLFEYERQELIGLPVEILIDEGVCDMYARHRFNFMQHAKILS